MATKYYGRTQYDFEPNVRILLKRQSVFVKMPEPDVTSPLYGKIDNGTDDSAGYDERKYNNSIMRFSPLFHRMRTLRKNIERTDSFLEKDELYSETAPALPGESEFYCDGRLDITCDGKIIRIADGEEIEITNDGTVYWKKNDPFTPVLTLEKGQRISHADYPYLDFLLKLGVEPELVSRTCVTLDFSDGISEYGGTLELSYVVELCGAELESTRLTLTLYPILGEKQCLD